MSQGLHRTPSEICGIEGAAGYYLDRGIYHFGTYVESEMTKAEGQANNAMFARSNRMRAFARCMGDDMETSTVGFANPADAGFVDQPDEILREGF